MKTIKRQILAILSLPAPLLVYIMASLPFGALYMKASFLSFLYKISGYRRKIIMQNLHNAFPEKTSEELKMITRHYYNHLGDVTLEAIKVLRVSPEALKKRLQLSHQASAILEKFYSEKKSIIVVMGHYGNWEWIGPGINLYFPGYLQCAYKPLKNPVVDRLIRKVRSSFVPVLVPSDQVPRHIISLSKNDQHNAFALIADQAPAPATAYWMEFLNQDTPFFTGPEKLAKKSNLPVIFFCLRKQKRGHYLIHAETITEYPDQVPPRHITTEYARLLGEEIIRAPQYWLWSHRRWKHKRKIESQ